MRRVLPDVERLAEAAAQMLAAKNAAREAALGPSRDATRLSANSIRAVHRGQFDEGAALADKAGRLISQARAALKDHPDILYAGFVHDAEKEYAEARITLALISGRGSLPTPADLQVEIAAYLNGLGEAVGELRRYLLDQLRLGDVERCEECLDVMEEIYGILVTFDYPEAMTGGLRHTTDSVRGTVERTRGDLAVAVRQRVLEGKLADFERRLGS